jgi:hypothetical protein
MRGRTQTVTVLSGEHRIRQLGEHEALAELERARKVAVESQNTRIACKPVRLTSPPIGQASSTPDELIMPTRNEFL